jgi:hypothetical protein
MNEQKALLILIAQAVPNATWAMTDGHDCVVHIKSTNAYIRVSSPGYVYVSLNGNRLDAKRLCYLGKPGQGGTLGSCLSDTVMICEPGEAVMLILGALFGEVITARIHYQRLEKATAKFRTADLSSDEKRAMKSAMFNIRYANKGALS